MTSRPVPVRASAALLVGALLALGATGVSGAAPADAAARVEVRGLGGRAAADPSGPTTLQLRGTGFQSVTGGFGGVYVVFGWVSGSWRPTQGGVTGRDLRYAPDTEAADNAGFQRFVAFSGSDTAGAANGGVVAADGSWSTTLIVPGARFAAVDRDGGTSTVDCTQVTCGVITIGAHGVKNATNETFTPVSFAGAAAAPATTGSGDAPAADAPAAESAVDPAAARLGVDQATAVLGRAMSFTGQGFLPGEQVVGSVDAGRLAVGPLAAGPHGEVAGFVELPADLRTGTHVLELRGAASGAAPQAQFTATRDPALVSAQEAAEQAAAEQAPTGPTWQEIAVGVAALVLLAVVVSSAVTGARRRRARRAAARPAAARPARPAPARPAASATRVEEPAGTSTGSGR